MPKLYSVTATNRAAWLADRRRRITASDVAPILGLGLYSRTPLSVWEEKTSSEPIRESAPSVEKRWGLMMEDDIVSLYAEETGAKLLDEQAYWTHAGDPLFSATLDGVVERDGELRVLELKSVHPGSKVAKLLGPQDTDELPEAILLQVQMQLEIADLERADVAVLLGSPPLRIYSVRRERGLFSAIAPRLRSWWEDHVQRRVAPGITDADDVRAVLSIHAKREGEKLIHDPRIRAEIDRFLFLDAIAKEIDSEKKKIRAGLASFLGACSRAQTEDGAYVLATKEITRKGYTVEATTFQDFRVRGPKVPDSLVMIPVPTPYSGKESA